MSILGTRVLRTEDPRFLTVGGTYTADLDDPLLDGALHVTFVRSMVAHGTITSIDVDEARRAPGVVAVFTGRRSRRPARSCRSPCRCSTRSTPGPVLATGKVRFVGEPLAVIVTETPEAGADAAELVWADIDFLPAVLTPDDALAGETLLFAEAGDNVASTWSFGEDDAVFDGCEVVVDRATPQPARRRLPARGPIGGRGLGRRSPRPVRARPRRPHGVKATLAGSTASTRPRSGSVAPTSGGGFGAKIGA